MTNIVLAAQSAQGSGMSMIIMMVAIFAIMWFFMIKPQQKKQKEIQKFQNELTEGTEVVTGGGIKEADMNPISSSDEMGTCMSIYSLCASIGTS